MNGDNTVVRIEWLNNMLVKFRFEIQSDGWENCKKNLGDTFLSHPVERHQSVSKHSYVLPGWVDHMFPTIYCNSNFLWSISIAIILQYSFIWKA